MGQRTHTPTGFRVAESCSSASEVDFIPAQRQCLARTPAAKGQEACNCDCRGPDVCSLGLPQRLAQRPVFGIGEPPVAPAICGPHDAMHRVVRAHSSPHRIGENCTQEPYSTVGRAFASSHARQSSGLGLGAGCGFSFSDIVHEALDVLARNSGDPELSKQRLDMTCNAASIDGQRACLLLGPPARHQPSCFGIGKVKIAQLGDRLSIARPPFLGGRIALVGDVTQ